MRLTLPPKLERSLKLNLKLKVRLNLKFRRVERGVAAPIDEGGGVERQRIQAEAVAGRGIIVLVEVDIVSRRVLCLYGTIETAPPQKPK